MTAADRMKFGLTTGTAHLVAGGVRAATACASRRYRALTGRLPRADSTIGDRCPPHLATRGVARRSPSPRHASRPAASLPEERRPPPSRRPTRGAAASWAASSRPPRSSRTGRRSARRLRRVGTAATDPRCAPSSFDGTRWRGWAPGSSRPSASSARTPSVGEPTLGLIGTFAMFGALIAAGLVRLATPALFGTAAAIFGFLVVRRSCCARSTLATPEQFGTRECRRPASPSQGIYQAGLGLPRRLVRRLPASAPDAAERRSRASDAPPVTPRSSRRYDPRPTGGMRLARMRDVDIERSRVVSGRPGETRRRRKLGPDATLCGFPVRSDSSLESSRGRRVPGPSVLEPTAPLHASRAVVVRSAQRLRSRGPRRPLRPAASHRRRLPRGRAPRRSSASRARARR